MVSSPPSQWDLAPNTDPSCSSCHYPMASHKLAPLGLGIERIAMAVALGGEYTPPTSILGVSKMN